MQPRGHLSSSVPQIRVCPTLLALQSPHKLASTEMTEEILPVQPP